VTRGGAADAWRDEVAGANEPLDGGMGANGARFIEALSFARLAAECAVRPVLALLAELPETLYFEARERGSCAQRKSGH
jgi:hypothetical protein